MDKGHALDRRQQRTVSHSENNAGFLHRSINLKTMFDRSGHRLLAQYIVSLRSEGLDEFHVHMVRDSNENGVCKTLSVCPDALRRSLVELLPCFEHETVVDAVPICEERLCLGSWLRNCYHLAFVGFQDRILRVGLGAEFRNSIKDTQDTQE